MSARNKGPVALGIGIGTGLWIVGVWNGTPNVVLVGLGLCGLSAMRRRFGGRGWQL